MLAFDLYHVKAGKIKMKQFLKGFPSVSCLGHIAVKNYENIESKIVEMININAG